MILVALAFLVLWWVLAGTFLKEESPSWHWAATTFIVAGGLDMAYIITRFL